MNNPQYITSDNWGISGISSGSNLITVLQSITAGGGNIPNIENIQWNATPSSHSDHNHATYLNTELENLWIGVAQNKTALISQSNSIISIKGDIESLDNSLTSAHNKITTLETTSSAHTEELQILTSSVNINKIDIKTLQELTSGFMTNGDQLKTLVEPSTGIEKVPMSLNGAISLALEKEFLFTINDNIVDGQVTTIEFIPTRACKIIQFKAFINPGVNITSGLSVTLQFWNASMGQWIAIPSATSTISTMTNPDGISVAPTTYINANTHLRIKLNDVTAYSNEITCLTAKVIYVPVF